MLPEALILAVGRVSIASAELEIELRAFLEEIFGWYHPSTLLIEGQDFDWLVSHIRLLLNWYVNSPEIGRFGRPPFKGRIIKALDQIGPLREKRNLVIHGAWRTRELCEFELEREEPSGGCIGRPFGGDDDEETFHLIRSRRRPKVFPPNQHWSIADVAELARQIAESHTIFRDARLNSNSA